MIGSTSFIAKRLFGAEATHTVPFRIAQLSKWLGRPVRPDDTRLRVLWCDERDLNQIREPIIDWIKAFDDRAEVAYSLRCEQDRKTCFIVSFRQAGKLLAGQAIPGGLPG